MSPRTLIVDGSSLRIAPATLAQIIPLRHRILRTGLPVEAASFDGDDAPTTLHAAVFDGNSVISAATLMLDQWQSQPAWRLRGMTTAENWQNLGVGAALLQYLLDWTATDPSIPQRITTFWCNARVPAISFYQRLGWTIASEEFDIPTAGPHQQMVRQL